MKKDFPKLSMNHLVAIIIIYLKSKSVPEIVLTLENSVIDCDGVLINTGARFDSKNLRVMCQRKGGIPNFTSAKRNTKNSDQNNYCFDSQLYKEHWFGLYYIDFSFILIRQVTRWKKYF